MSTDAIVLLKEDHKEIKKKAPNSPAQPSALKKTIDAVVS
jgi:hypothetical protein